LVNLILAIVSMSYLGQQKLVEAENEERDRRKIKDELELQNEEAEARLSNDIEQHVENALCFEDSNYQMSYSGVSIEYEQNGKVNHFEVFLK
jgi:hypothetical protein